MFAEYLSLPLTHCPSVGFYKWGCTLEIVNAPSKEFQRDKKGGPLTVGSTVLPDSRSHTHDIPSSSLQYWIINCLFPLNPISTKVLGGWEVRLGSDLRRREGTNLPG